MVVVVGGHSRKIGKTSVAAGLIRKLRNRHWTAVKITQFGHDVCGHGGECRDCEVEPGEPFTLCEEYEPGKTDSGRFLAAGADRSFWLRTAMGDPRRAGTIVRRILDQSENVMIESNSVLELLEPDVFLMVLDFSCQDFKPSSLRFMDRVDAFLIVDRGINAPLWAEVARGLWDHKPQFLIKPPGYVTAELCDFVSSRFAPPVR